MIRNEEKNNENDLRVFLSSPTEDKKGNSSIRFQSFSRKESIPEDEVVLRERSFDYKHRYCGHCNTTTDIKEANFFGRYLTPRCRSAVVSLGGSLHLCHDRYEGKAIFCCVLLLGNISEALEWLQDSSFL